jgi:hypothetical protein
MKFLLTILIFASQIQAKNINFEVLMKEYQKDFYLLGQKQDILMKNFLEKVITYQIDKKQIIEYALKENILSSKEISSLEKELKTNMDQENPYEMAFLIKNILSAQNYSGANFLSCQSGVKVGLAITVVGALVATIAIVRHLVQYPEITKYDQSHIDTYYDEQQESIDTAEATAIEFHTEYGDWDTEEELEEIIQAIQANWDISRQNVEELREIDIHNFQLSYFDYIDEKNIELAEKKEKLKKTSMIAGIVSGIGMLTTGASVSTCE